MCINSDRKLKIILSETIKTDASGAVTSGDEEITIMSNEANEKMHFEEKESSANKIINKIVNESGRNRKYLIVQTTEGKKYKCNECEKLYTTSFNLRLHMHSHVGFKPFSCEICGKGFMKLITLNSHIAIHKGNQSYLCNSCGKGFTSSSTLNRHKRTHTGK